MLLARVASNKKVIVTIDQSLQSRGGVLTGTDLIKWLKDSLDFQGIMISSSGDAFIGKEHVSLGAHLAWGKPLPPKQKVQADIINCFKMQRATALSKDTFRIKNNQQEESDTLQNHQQEEQYDHHIIILPPTTP
mmetsp:Transcript_20061/g.25958  ORF Transcript_20061/g.25958 Transcript_20061/m.25958 type:complete len:134 (-) Transcript_20061:205-606(-)